jgi:adenosylmethionine-8-amino-7-oxononanoate aminotransferase
VLVRSTADTIALSPPLIVERDQITRMFEVLSDVLHNVA